MMPEVVLPTRPISSKLKTTIENLRPGQRIQITQKVRVGSRSWTTTVEGVFRDVNFLATGLATDRVPEDDILVPTVHFIKNNGELSSITLDENTELTVLP